MRGVASRRFSLQAGLHNVRKREAQAERGARVVAKYGLFRKKAGQGTVFNKRDVDSVRHRQLPSAHASGFRQQPPPPTENPDGPREDSECLEG
jgi:hypothetical protein